MMQTLSSTASPVASEVSAILGLLAISVVVVFILRYYLPLRTTPAFLLVPVFFALWLPASMVLLVPIDLASSATVDDDTDARGVWLPRHGLRVSWRITYWLTFCLTWFILPILAEYSDSGYREPKDKLVDSLRSNAQYYAIVFGSGVLGLIYVLFSYGHFSESLKSTVMALAYCWGLILAIYLMGHGLVSIPRRLFRNANISGRLRRIQTQAPSIYEKMEEAELELAELEQQVAELSRRKGGSVTLYEDWVEELVDLANLPEGQLAANPAPRGSGDRGALPNVITDKYLASLTRRLVRARHARSRWVGEWNYLLRQAVRTQAILDSAASKKLDFGRPSPDAGIWERFSPFNPYTRHLFYYNVVPYLYMALGGVLSLASACIVWSEVVKGLFPTLSIIRYSVVHHQLAGDGQVGLAGQVIAAAWMLYMCAAALISITEVKVWRGRALVRRNTAHEPAFWYASQVARLSVPLSYNFMTFLGGIYRQTVFYDFLGQLINLTPLGTWFDYLFPAFILLPVGATLFGLYGKLKRAFGFGLDVLDDDDSDPHSFYGTGSWREGRDLIERELNGTSASIRSARAAAGEGWRAPDGRRAAPVLSIPAAPSSLASGRRGAPTTPLATSPNSRPQANTSARRSRGPVLDEPEDENFFEALGHRFRNTIDTMDTPKWFQDLGSGIKKPKWMGGDDDHRDRAGASASGSRNGNSDLRSWFGGGNGEGRIRL